MQASKHNGGFAVQVVEDALGRLAERVTPTDNQIGDVASLEGAKLTLEDFGLAPSGRVQRQVMLADETQHPRHLMCPVTLALLVDPVTTKYGHTYERSAIAEHLERSQTDPLTKQPLTTADVFPNYCIAQALSDYRSSLSQ